MIFSNPERLCIVIGCLVFRGELPEPNPTESAGSRSGLGDQYSNSDTCVGPICCKCRF